MDINTREIFAKFYQFVVDNYEPSRGMPSYDPKKEFLVELVFKGNISIWHGPISFEDLTAFADALPETERTKFIKVIKAGEEAGELWT